jgi:hypothetical protein
VRDFECWGVSAKIAKVQGVNEVSPFLNLCHIKMIFQTRDALSKRREDLDLDLDLRSSFLPFHDSCARCLLCRLYRSPFLTSCFRSSL